MTVISQNESIPKRLLKASEVAKLLCCSTSLVYTLIRQGKLKTVAVKSSSIPFTTRFEKATMIFEVWHLNNFIRQKRIAFPYKPQGE